uniref:MATE family efflux transporter n=1 Tax=Streptomyces corallincola TaxID=2851888 RepID=UPI0027E352BF|nr:MATE family efflux transporter [Streptomyces corallincola]
MKGERGVWVGVGRAALPLYMSMIAASAGALVDTALLGRSATEVLAAFAVAVAVFSPAVSTVAGGLRGVMPFVASGKDDPRALSAVVRSGMWLAVLLGGLAAGVVLAVPWIGAAAGVPRETLDALGVFPVLLAGSTLAVAVGSSASSVLVALGHARLVMRAGLLGTGVSVALSVLLVGGPGPLPGFGLTGAGVAMLVSSAVSACVNQVQLRRFAPVGALLHPGRPDVRRIWRLAAVGIPLAGTVLLKFAVLGVLTFAAARLGSVSAAVHSVGISLANLVYTAAVAVGQAVVPPVAEHAGRRDTPAVRATTWAGTWLACAVVGVLGVAAVLLGERIVLLFSSDPAVRRYVTDLLPLVAVVGVTDALQAVPGFALIGLRRTVPAFTAVLVCYGVLAAVAVPVAASGGLMALWTALALANLGQAVGKGYFLHRHSAFPEKPVSVPAAG